MLFNSVAFLVFAAVCFACWPLFRPRPAARYTFLVVSSAVFYAWWDWRFLFLLLATGLVDYFAALAMARHERGRRTLLWLSLAANLGTLVVFKFGNAAFSLILPIGISFITFQSLTYTLDVYHRKLEPTRDIRHYFAFKTLWPLLLAGPIMRAADLLPQLAASPRPSGEDRWQGLRLIGWGFFQKLVLADGLAPVVNEAFAAREPAASTLYWWLVLAALAMQIYCDFSGYSNIARGLGRWLGYDFVENFRHPYTARSFSDFWQRWHISLSAWIWRYVFSPLSYACLRLVGRLELPTVEQEMRLAYPAAAVSAMALCGLWHGVGWTFLAWGALHGIYLAVEKLTDAPRRLRRVAGGRHLGAVLVLLLVWLGWVFFRATSFTQAGLILKRLFSFTGSFEYSYDLLGGAALLNLGILLLLAGLREVAHYPGPDRLWTATARRLGALEPLGLAVLIAAAVYLRGPSAKFIYFQF
jgi:alginate O-acetyltransferase complex protein AlgI